MQENQENPRALEDRSINPERISLPSSSDPVIFFMSHGVDPAKLFFRKDGGYSSEEFAKLVQMEKDHQYNVGKMRREMEEQREEAEKEEKDADAELKEGEEGENEEEVEEVEDKTGLLT